MPEPGAGFEEGLFTQRASSNFPLLPCYDVALFRFAVRKLKIHPDISRFLLPYMLSGPRNDVLQRYPGSTENPP